jgi:anti-sigma B factor antagonist
MSDPDSLMMISTATVGSAVVVTVAGELDLHTARELMTSVDDTFALPDLGGVVIDLTGVSFLGSSGLGTLAGLATRAPACRPGAAPVAVLPLYPDVTAALADLPR